MPIVPIRLVSPGRAPKAAGMGKATAVALALHDLAASRATE
jgi:hypothetical protein